MRSRPAVVISVGIFLLATGSTAPQVSAEVRQFTDASLEFFEKEVRPILVKRCYQCHSAQVKEPKGGLRMDARSLILAGGETGPAVDQEKPQASLLIDAINYGEIYQMPPKSKLPAREIETLSRWVELGLPWPDEPAAELVARETFDLARRRAEHWCWQPLVDAQVPSIEDPNGSQHPVDRFILHALREAGLSPAAPADRGTLIRRAYFDLVGLPPAPDEVRSFVNDPSPRAFEMLVDRLLDSPHFGERWARHWLDLVRYAESRGHEFDYDVPNAYQYRDYVIRALNANVPYDQFVVEHIAGDLLDRPRMHPTEDFNESILGTGFWFLGEWVHSPVDIRQDETDRFDNMVDVFGKTFLGLTIGCARCHDHKFDAIAQQDYYALFGYLQSSSYRQARFDTQDYNRRIAKQLEALRDEYRPRLARAMAQHLQQADPGSRSELLEQLRSLRITRPRPATEGVVEIIDYQTAEPQEWISDGPTFGLRPKRLGELILDGSGDSPARVMQHGAARRDAAFAGLTRRKGTTAEAGKLSKWDRAGRTLRTPTFTIRHGLLGYLVRGEALAYAVVDSHRMINGPLHSSIFTTFKIDAAAGPQWFTHDLRRYKGHGVHVEFVPLGDAPLEVLRVVDAKVKQPPEKPQPLDLDQRQLGDLLDVVLDLLAADKLENADDPRVAAAIADWLLQQDKLPPGKVARQLKAQYLSKRDELIGRIRQVSRTAPAMWDGTGHDERLMIRGNHKTLGELVPRGLPVAIDTLRREPISHGSGRLELARQMVDPANPLTSRVIVNRVWHHLTGRGIVASVDNLGVLGQQPTHAELLDYLAANFVRPSPAGNGWSIKQLIRSIMLSRSYQMSSEINAAAAEVDPDNSLLHRARVRRMQGEVVRDTMLAISGDFDPSMFGPPIPVHLTPFMTGRGQPKQSGSLNGDGRRSIYVSVRRNFLSPMMLAFDVPQPFNTVGQRTVSNVPGQALILMNNPFVLQQAATWAQRLTTRADQDPAGRIDHMYRAAFARPPSAQELAEALAFLKTQQSELGVSTTELMSNTAVWTDLCHVLMNVKEFIFIH